jgi:hypothetical protein
MNTGFLVMVLPKRYHFRVSFIILCHPRSRVANGNTRKQSRKKATRFRASTTGQPAACRRRCRFSFNLLKILIFALLKTRLDHDHDQHYVS